MRTTQIPATQPPNRNHAPPPPNTQKHIFTKRTQPISFNTKNITPPPRRVFPGFFTLKSTLSPGFHPPIPAPDPTSRRSTHP